MHAERTSPKTRGRKVFTVAARAVPVLGLALLLLLVVWLAVPGGPREPTDTPADDDAVLQRINACRDAPLARLIAHTSDTDWRVRAAAYAELAKHAPIENTPLRDTPINEREAIILDWLARHQPDFASGMCEWYVRPDPLRFGGPLAQRCLACHAGAEPTPKLTDTRCISCHETIHAQWAGTAHANSLSHLPLVTIDPATRQQEPLDFAGRKGMSCVACHEPAGHAAGGDAPGTPGAPGTPDGHGQAGCVASFRTVSCGTCHNEAQTQWQTWRDATRYRRAVWPPGAMELSDEEPGSCAGCHMPAGEHLWAARRSVPMLQSGLAVNVSRAPDGRVVLTLRNLAGHNYPTGTTRRALLVYAQLDDGPQRLVATLADTLPGTTDPAVTGPTLAPGEARAITLPGKPGRVRARLLYARNRFVQDAYTVEVFSLDHVFPTADGIE